MNWFVSILGFIFFVTIVIQIQKSEKSDHSDNFGEGIAIGISALMMIAGVFL